ncbi:hypothetical protein D1J36_002100 [Riemerella anatipestifer]|uniref:hypothetical protein n=1 Tax=Riemerella anatipestifer TaxID=34085 RepID=UPI0012AE54F4|nr:hypothetical protein [Riemerella anatipestifer]USL95925.1 hypothetical protein D1J36_002100 [Riemerella anatipestifer]
MNLKYISVLCFLAGATAYGQVKTNQPTTIDPKSNTFLDASENTESQLPSIGKGLLFPQTDLSTFKLDVNAADGINYPTYFDGMIVYNTKEGGKTSDTNIQVTDNLQKGFYYFSNPTGKTIGNITNGKWVRLSDTQANDQLWAQRTNNNIVETYLKPAADDQNKFYYSDNGLHLNFGNVDAVKESLFEDGEFVGFDEKSIPNSTAISSNRFPNNSLGGKPGSRGLFYFNQKLSTINNEHPSLGEAVGTKAYIGDESRIISRNSSGDIGTIIAHISSAGNYTTNNLKYLGGSTVYTAAGLVDGSVAPVMEVNEGLRVYPRNYQNAISKVMKGIYAEPKIFGGKVNDMYGVDSMVSSLAEATNGAWSANTLYEMMGNRAQLMVRPNTTVNRAFANYAYFRANTGSNVSDEAIGVGASGVFSEGAVVKSYAGVSTYAYADGAANVENFYGFRFWHKLNAAFSPVKMYGIFLDNVNKGSELNYSIYTNAGKIHFGDNVGIGVEAPAEKLEVAGNVKATGFIGSNASIFPDYVFQKYYTGTSSIKADYSFKTLSQVEDFVKANGHLPGYQSAAEIKKQGYVDIMATQLTNVEKIEELYLHLLEKDKEVKDLKAKNEELESRLQKLEALLVK